MARNSFRASAPGSIMLFGEHAVLHGRPAIVAAVDQRLQLTLSPQANNRIHIHSVLGTYRAAMDQLEPDPRFSFLLEAVRQAGPLPSGCKMEVHSALPPTVGYGSSAAVTTAACKALAAWKGEPSPSDSLLKRVVRIIRAVQGTGSGSDAAASVYGGLLGYQADSITVVPIDFLPPISMIYCGYKTPTVEVIRRVEAAFKDRPGEVTGIYDEMGRLSSAAAEALRRSDLAETGRLMNQSQACMERLGVSDSTLDRIVHQLREADGITGAKISGSGLGDCAIGIGSTDVRVAGFDKMEAALSVDGVCLEEVERPV